MAILIQETIRSMVRRVELCFEGTGSMLSQGLTFRERQIMPLEVAP